MRKIDNSLVGTDLSLHTISSMQISLDQMKIDFDLGNKPTVDNHYKHTKIRKALFKCHKKKCAYCETVLNKKNKATNNPNSNKNNEIEHYRPKGSYRQDRSNTSSLTGYYWLAYEASNLLLSCPICNRNKDDLFPLKTVATRCVNHHYNINIEDPLLLNPTIVDPNDHVYFDKEVIKHKTTEGQVTIDCLDLNRQNLLDERLRVYAPLFIQWNLLPMLNGSTKEDSENQIFARFEEAVEGKCAYSKMIIDNFSLV